MVNFGDSKIHFYVRTIFFVSKKWTKNIVLLSYWAAAALYSMIWYDIHCVPSVECCTCIDAAFSCTWYQVYIYMPLRSYTYSYRLLSTRYQSIWNALYIFEHVVCIPVVDQQIYQLIGSEHRANSARCLQYHWYHNGWWRRCLIEVTSK